MKRTTVTSGGPFGSTACRVPGDAEIRRLLKAQLSDQHRHQPGTMLIEEFGLCRGQVRVDVAVVNGTLHGYEIKSDRDSLRRLAHQVEFYGQVLDRATLVVGPRHVDEAQRIAPVWWGVQSVLSDRSGITLKQTRSGRRNPSRVARSLVELLWLDECIGMLEARNAVRGFRGKPRRLVWDRLCQLYSLKEIASAVRLHVKTREVNGVARPPG